MRVRNLEERIEVLRQEMEQHAMDLGFSHPHVHHLSQQLDQLHNQWQKSRRRPLFHHCRSQCACAAG